MIERILYGILLIASIAACKEKNIKDKESVKQNTNLVLKTKIAAKNFEGIVKW